MRLGVTGRSRTGTSGFTAHGSSIELRPHPSARLSGLGGRSRTCGLVIPNHARFHLRHTELNLVLAGGNPQRAKRVARSVRPVGIAGKAREHRPAPYQDAALRPIRTADPPGRNRPLWSAELTRPGLDGPIARCARPSARCFATSWPATPSRANGRGLSPSGLQPDAFGHLATPRCLGTGPRNRTANLRLWRPLLCQLS